MMEIFKPKGSFQKRYYYLMSGIFRLVSSMLLFVAYIVVGVTVEPDIIWLMHLLGLLGLLALFASISNFVMIKYFPKEYKEKTAPQIINLIITALSLGFASVVFSALALGIKVTDDELPKENKIEKDN